MNGDGDNTFVKLLPGWWLIPCLVLLICGCSIGQNRSISKDNAGQHLYANPVFEPILADPSVLREPETGVFYAYGTQDNWGDGEGSRLIPILRSVNLVNWEVVGEAFEKKPGWKSKGGLWAPDVNLVDGTYYLYYSYSVWGDPNPGIGVATANHPTGPFKDQGKLFTSEEVGVPNSIDPFFHEENDQKYLFWGSYNDSPAQGTYGIPLAEDGLSAPDFSRKIKIAAGDFEGVMIHYRAGYYYFFGSKGNCCEGADTKYHVMIGRSKNLMGPYVDKKGNPLTERGNGTLFIQGNEIFVGPGHNARLVTDDEGTDWFIYHGIDRNQGKVSSGATRRMLMMDPVIWQENGWPMIKGNTPSTTPLKSPVFKR